MNEEYEDPAKWPWEKYRNYLVWTSERNAIGPLDWESVARTWYDKYQEIASKDGEWQRRFEQVRIFVNNVK